jgi:hypothetical protein
LHGVDPLEIDRRPLNASGKYRTLIRRLRADEDFDRRPDFAPVRRSRFSSGLTAGAKVRFEVGSQNEAPACGSDAPDLFILDQLVDRGPTETGRSASLSDGV